MSTQFSGSCCCKEISFSVDGPLRGIINCHCNDCQKLHGTYAPLAIAAKTGVTITDTNNNLRWWQSSESSERGFCNQCGARLFMKKISGDNLLISAGMFNDDLGLEPIKNVFEADAGTYYKIPAVTE